MQNSYVFSQKKIHYSLLTKKNQILRTKGKNFFNFFYFIFFSKRYCLFDKKNTTNILFYRSVLKTFEHFRAFTACYRLFSEKICLFFGKILKESFFFSFSLKKTILIFTQFKKKKKIKITLDYLREKNSENKLNFNRLTGCGFLIIKLVKKKRKNSFKNLKLNIQNSSQQFFSLAAKFGRKNLLLGIFIPSYKVVNTPKFYQKSKKPLSNYHDRKKIGENFMKLLKSLNSNHISFMNEKTNKIYHNFILNRLDEELYSLIFLFRNSPSINLIV